MKKENYAQKIINEYTEKKESSVDKLKALDKKVKTPPRVFSYIFGVLGSLILGFGMCLSMKVLFDLMPLGIVIGVVGIAIVSVNYPIYKKMLSKRMSAYRNEILALSNEMLKEN